MTDTDTPAAASGTIQIGDATVHRMGYGAMRITGKGIWGPPPDHDTAITVLRTAVELGVDFIDTADSYGPEVSEDLIREALHPYDGVTIATKGGLTRSGPDEWRPVGRPEYLRQCVEMSLRRLDVEAIDLWQLHRIDRKVPAEEQFGFMAEMVQQGKVKAVGLSQVDVDQLSAAREVVEIASVQNLYNLADRSSADVVSYCEAEGIAFIPWFPIAAAQLADGEHTQGETALAQVAEEVGATPAQVSLAWLLASSPVQVPIPGTGSVEHLRENVAAAAVELSDEQVQRLTDMVDG
ncbi:aldo/keto reductase [Euzebya sp.]|uniref:aldo/keto reductase n=1 Tax=Euzebya sp. TaxID=1971409 RepID=UPI003516F698